MQNEQTIWVTLISTLGGITITYLSVKYKNQISTKLSRQPKDRMDLILDGYDRLIKEQQQDITRKSLLIDHMERAMSKLSTQIDALRSELSETKFANESLQRQLAKMKEEFKK